MSRRTVQVLLVEDNAGDARLLREMLRQAHADHYRLTHVQRLSAARKHLENNHVDAVLLDLELPDSQGLDTVLQVHEAAPSVPIVVLSRLDDEVRAIEALQEGAQDYLVKGQIGAHLLLRAIRYAIERHRMQAALRSLSLIDDLTGLYNRRGFFTLAEQCLKMSRRNGSAFLMVFLDLDGLKQINDRFGHSEGNLAVIQTAEVLRQSFRQSDILARLGGDEFIALVMDASQDSAEVVQRRLQRKVDACNAQNGRRFKLSLSVGIARFRAQQACSIEDMVAQVDARMYEEKHGRRTPAARGLVGTQRDPA